MGIGPSLRVGLDFLKGAGAAIAFMAAGLTEPLKWPRALGFMTDVDLAIGVETRRAIFVAAAFIWMFVWYYGVRARYEAKPRPKFTMEVQSVIWGGISRDTPPRSPVIAVVAVRNSGSIPSILHQWEMLIREGDKETLLRGMHLGERFTCHNGRGMQVTYATGDEIYEKTTNPVPPGGMATGHFAGIMPDGSIAELGPGKSLVIRCLDVVDQRHESVYCFDGKVIDGKPTWIPGMKFQKIQGAQ